MPCDELLAQVEDTHSCQISRDTKALICSIQKSTYDVVEIVVQID